MNDWIRIGGWALLALVLLWVVMQLVSFIFGLVSWLITTAVTLLIVGALLYIAYLAVSKFTGGSGGSGGRSRSRERERIFE